MDYLSILIADDEVLTRLDLREMLESAGHLVCGEAKNGLEAVELAERTHPDLAILDILMPGLDGLEVAKIFHSKNIPVILLTAYSQRNFVSRADKVHVFSYLVKPITEQHLLPAIQIAYARWKELQSVQNELVKTQQQLKNQKLIAYAKSLLAAQNGITEYDAHRLLLHKAMCSQISLVEMASRIIKQAEK